MKEQSAMTEDQTLARWGNLANLARVVVALAAFVFGRGFVYDHYWNAPCVEYIILPVYSVGGQSFSGLVVENKGRGTAHEVVIKASDLSETIQAMDYKSDEVIALANGGEGTEEFVLCLHRLAMHSSVTIHFITGRPMSIDGLLTVTFEEGRAVAAPLRTDSQGVTAMLLAACLTGVAIMVVEYTLERWLRIWATRRLP